MTSLAAAAVNTAEHHALGVAHAWHGVVNILRTESPDDALHEATQAHKRSAKLLRQIREIAHKAEANVEEFARAA